MPLPTTIREVRFFETTSPLSRPIADATHSIGQIAFLVAELVLQNGERGQGYLLSFDYSRHAIRGALRDVGERIVGVDCARTGDWLKQLGSEHEYFGQEGLQRWALGLINVAMWDAWSRSLGVGMHRIFGVCRDDVPVYGSGGWLSYSDAELIDEVTGYRDRGFDAVKIKVGSREPGRDLERLRQVREAVGPALRIMMDANQGMSLPDAIALSRAAAPLGITWFEEPLNHRDYDGYATLRRQTGIAIAMGEREYDCEALLALIARGGIDLWQPDLLRLGSVEAWRASAAIAGAHHIPVLPHYYRDYDVPLLCGIPNGYGAESFDWIDAIIDTPITITNGRMRPRDGAGWGFRFRESALTELRF